MSGRRSVGAGWLDDTCPPLGDLLPVSVDADAFRTWLGERLGEYRASMQAREAMQRAGELGALAEVADALASAAEALRAGPGPRGDMFATLEAARLGLDWAKLTAQLRRDLALARAVLRDSQDKLGAAPPERGRRPAHARAALLRALVARLCATPMPATEARAVAADILKRCHVPVPDGLDDRALRRAVKGPK